MTTPLEQIKERLEKMKNPFESRQNSEPYNIAITDVQELLPSIIQEVVEHTRKEEQDKIRYKCPRCDGDGFYTESVECEHNSAMGEIVTGECWKCKGTGIYKPASLKEESK